MSPTTDLGVVVLLQSLRFKRESGMPSQREKRMRRARAMSLLRTRIAILLTLLVATGSVVTGMLRGASASDRPAATELGFLPGGKVDGLKALEAFVGHPAKFVVQNADYRSAHQFESSVWGEVTDTGQFQTLSNRLTFVLSVPLTIGLGFGASSAQRAAALNATASGANDFPIRYISQLLAKGGYPDAIIRLGWEFDGNWMPWSAVGNEAVWVRAYQHVHDVMRSVSSRFRFDWNGDPGFVQSELAAYPGDNYVDIIGHDVYDQPGGIPWNASTKTWVDPNAAWNFFLPRLRFQRDFAIMHGKQVSYPEWALSGANAVVPANVGGDDPTFIQGMYDWMNSLPASGPGSLAYSSYFNQDTDSNHRIDSYWFPKASALFKQLFGATGGSTSDFNTFPNAPVGYSMLSGDGSVYAFGAARNHGNAAGGSMAIASRYDGSGYWIVDSAGNVRNFGTAGDHGGHPALGPNDWVSSISATPSGNGYWLFTIRGRVFAYGDARSYGDLGGVRLNGPVIGSVATPSGHGYYMVASDGGVFSFGDAHFHGSMGSAHLNKPVVGLAPTKDGRGYWLVAADGGVFAFRAPFKGSMGGQQLARPVNGLVPYGNGYLMVASDGGVFDFSSTQFVGSLGGHPVNAPIIGIAPVKA